MHSELQLVNQRLTKYTLTGKTTLSFRNFHSHLRHQHALAKGIRKEQLAIFIRQFDAHPEWLQPIDLDRVADYETLFALVHAAVEPTAGDTETKLWGLGAPLWPAIFYGTDAFYSLIDKRVRARIPDSLKFSEDEKIDKWHYEFVYSFILRKVFNMPITPHGDLTYSYIDEDTGLLKYLAVRSDLRYVEVKQIQPLPAIDTSKVANALDCALTGYLQEKLPIDAFHFEGFAILTVEDVTTEKILENIRNTMLEHDPTETGGVYREVLTLLKSLVGNSAVQFGMLPMVELNGHLLSSYENDPFSILANTASKLSIPQSVFLDYMNGYRAKPKSLIFHATGAKENISWFDQLFLHTGMQSLALIPVFHNNALVGILEAYSDRAGVLQETNLTQLENVLPLLAQLLQKSILDFNAYMDHTIKDVFTPLQPSVEWKFREAVWEYRKDHFFGTRRPAIPAVSFEDIYPLYGAIDIRNSTVERNKALRTDLIFQVKLLLHTLDEIDTQLELPGIDELILKSNIWRGRVEDHAIHIDETALKNFIEDEVLPPLRTLYDKQPTLQAVIQTFLDATNEQTGTVFQQRRMLETSMQRINTAISEHLELFRRDLNKLYPSYFEKFRTDGVEYDVYVGQSIAPTIPFELAMVDTFQQRQLRFMASISRITRRLMPRMEVPLQTTQLIFVHPATIDISFRNDERRFDVEGTYNIRYQIIKKRIDKANIKDTRERLTQPGKIAVVYYRNDFVAERYKHYIQMLQQEGLLKNDLEELELEELQGIHGLVALRVGVL
jgi:hypothetical protein